MSRKYNKSFKLRWQWILPWTEQSSQDSDVQVVIGFLRFKNIMSGDQVCY
jgi:hypothetical protein